MVRRLYGSAIKISGVSAKPEAGAGGGGGAWEPESLAGPAGRVQAVTDIAYRFERCTGVS